MTAKTIDDVVTQLDAIVAQVRQTPSRLGFFAALYRNFTVKVRDGIAAGQFDDGPRMEQLDVTFANRYLDTFSAFQVGDQPSRSWLLAFQAAADRTPLILQHLLVGINAHINLDLGIAAAMTAPSDQLAGLKSDFDKINGMLSNMLVKLKADIDQVSPWIRLIDGIDPTDEKATTCAGSSTSSCRVDVPRRFNDYRNEFRTLPAPPSTAAWMRGDDLQVRAWQWHAYKVMMVNV